MTDDLPEWMARERREKLQREAVHDAAARQVDFTEVAFEVEVYLGGQGGIVPMLRNDGRHRDVPLGRYLCIRSIDQ
jgi:hypothetical protein